MIDLLSKKNFALALSAVIIMFIINGYQVRKKNTEIINKILSLGNARVNGEKISNAELESAISKLNESKIEEGFHLTMEVGYLNEYLNHFVAAKHCYERALRKTNDPVERVLAIRQLANAEERNATFQDWSYMQNLKSQELKNIALLSKIDFINYSAFSHDLWSRREKYKNDIRRSKVTAQRAAYFYELKEKIYPQSKFVEDFNARYKQTKIGEKPDFTR